MSQVTKDLNKIDSLVDIAQSIYIRPGASAEDHERMNLLRAELVAEIPPSLVKILAIASDKDLCNLTNMRSLDGAADEVRKAARIRLDRIELIEEEKLNRLLSERWRRHD